MASEKRPLGLYIHIPFCVRKCLYCDFLSHPASEEERENYVRILCRQIELRGPVCGKYRVDSVFFGGGTPSLLTPDQIRRLFASLHKGFRFMDDCEMTMECNPGTLDEDKLRAMRDSGVNRLSLGLQSADDGELKTLGRIHCYRDFEKNYELARSLGFNNINVDLMSSLPGQTAESFRASLEKVISLKPEHLSVYSLIIEPGTAFYDRYREGEGLPDEDTELLIDEITRELLKNAGYLRYEISNYARPGFACRHNLKYWRSQEYLGFGTGAVSLMKMDCGIIPKGTVFHRAEDARLFRMKNACDQEGFEKFHAEYIRGVALKDEREEFCLVGLRLTEGISLAEFERRFGESFTERYRAVIDKYRPCGLMEVSEERVRLTEQGLNVSNTILEDFLED